MFKEMGILLNPNKAKGGKTIAIIHIKLNVSLRKINGHHSPKELSNSRLNIKRTKVSSPCESSKTYVLLNGGSPETKQRQV